MKIIEYQFGRLSTDSHTFTTDVILTNSKVYPDWWRKEGHKLHWQDIATVVHETSPEILVVGLGKFGMMKILPEVEEELSRMGIELVSGRTGKAVHEFNRLVENNQIAGAFHLTC